MGEPDFEQIARQALASLVDTQTEPQYHPPGHGCAGCVTVVAVTKALRQVWTARGAADREAITASVEYLVILAKAKEPPDVLAQIRALDR